jgi:FimV-like protein
VQGSGVLSDPVPPNNPEKSDTRPATSFQLKGVLISDSERTALVNGELIQEGDRVGGVEILAIDQAGVRVLAGAQELTVDVGGTFVGDQSVGDQSSNDVTGVSRIDANLRHAVKPGETLSGIALQYLEDGVTMNQMMIALFQANTQAFDDNINVLYEGATLRIPDQDELDHQVPETATAEVTRHREMPSATTSTCFARAPSCVSRMRTSYVAKHPKWPPPKLYARRKHGRQATNSSQCSPWHITTRWHQAMS